MPVSIADNGSKQAWTYSFYLQDEWEIAPAFTLNYGLRFDQFNGFIDENQLSPRINAVWKPLDGTTVHLGYSRYFSPPPFELVADTSVEKFVGTTATAPLLLNDTPRAERANYFDAGVDQEIADGVTVGADVYYKISKNLVDEGQFGAPIILTPFNYARGKQYGAELTATYDVDPFSAYANFSVEQAMGKDIVSSQFSFDPGDLAYIEDNYIHLDHEQYISLSAGASYRWDATVFSADMLVGSGLRSDGAVPNGNKLPAYAQVNLGLNHAFDLGNAGDITARFDILNLFDTKYEIRDGSGIGVGAPQYGARRGFFVGLSKSL
jgi:outer membrane receptor protein involved in Fe transport